MVYVVRTEIMLLLIFSGLYWLILPILKRHQALNTEPKVKTIAHDIQPNITRKKPISEQWSWPNLAMDGVSNMILKGDMIRWSLNLILSQAMCLCIELTSVLWYLVLPRIQKVKQEFWEENSTWKTDWNKNVNFPKKDDSPPRLVQLFIGGGFSRIFVLHLQLKSISEQHLHWLVISHLRRCSLYRLFEQNWLWR